MSNAVLERIHQVLRNIVRTCSITHYYVDKQNPWLVILVASSFAIHSTKNGIRFYSPVQLIFGRDTIIPIKHTVDWEIIRQKNQTQINKNDIHKNRN